jgi:hypothetical protein
VLRRDRVIVRPELCNASLAAGARMLTMVEFRSGRFPPLQGEQEQINPDLWGRRLADFLREGLAREGYQTDHPVAEDWGWCVRLLNQPFSTWIGCGHYQEHDDSYLCFIQPDRPRVWKGLRRIDTREHVARLQQAMDKVLSVDLSIYAKRWWTAEAFNEPSASNHRELDPIEPESV